MIKDSLNALIELLKLPYGMGFILALAFLLGPWIVCGFGFVYFADSQSKALGQLHADIIGIVRCVSDDRKTASVPR